MKNLPSQEKAVDQTSDVQLPNNWKYEEAVAHVEAMINKIESGKMELAEVFDTFATALEYLRQCDSFLSHRRQHMDLLVENLVEPTEPF